MTSGQPTLDVHIGVASPALWDERDRNKATNPLLGKRPAITSESIDWDALRLTPRWLGEDSSRSVAALEPGRYEGHGAQEWERFWAGSQSRGETAVVLSMLRPSSVPTSILNRNGAWVTLVGSDDCSVGGVQIALASVPDLAPELIGADRNLALRIRDSRSVDAPWWSLELSVHEIISTGYRAEPATAEGEITPLLLSSTGEVVAAAWVSPDRTLRHYIVPLLSSYKPVLEWLVDQAIPEFVPAAARRLRRSLAGELALQTAAETTAQAALVEFEAATAQQRAVLESVSAAATTEADVVRGPLLYGTGKDLVAAVARVLTDAGIAVIDLDELFGDTISADLLGTYGGRRRLVEVKSASGNPGERLAEAAGRHLATWPNLKPGLPVDGVALVLNHQVKTHPLDRSSAPFSRPEFVASLTFPVVTTGQLYDWWRISDLQRIREAFFGEEPPITPPIAVVAEVPVEAPPVEATPGAATGDTETSNPAPRRWWQRWHNE